MLNTSDTTLNESILRQFTGTENWYRHPLFKHFTYTDGVKYVAEQGGEYWLIDKIFGAQYSNINLPEQEFQVWILEHENIRGATLVCHDGDYNYQHHEKLIFSDFPMSKITLYFCNSVLLLLSEY